MRKSSLLLLLFLLLSALLGCESKRNMELTQQKNIVIFVIDGCRPDYLDDASIPNIESLRKEGMTYSDAWVGGLRNISSASHTMLGTGSFPKRNGVVCVLQKDPDSGTLGFYSTWDEIISGNFSRRLDKRGITSISKLYKQVYPDAVTVSLSSSRFFAAAAMGYGADYILFNNSFESNYNFVPNKEYSLHGDGSELLSNILIKGKDEDEWVMNLALIMSDLKNPNVLLINFPMVDYVGHMTADSNTMRVTVENADAQIGRLISKYKEKGIYDNTIWVVTSDHGMTTNPHWISQSSINAIAGNITPNPEFYLLDANNNSKEVASLIKEQNIEGIKAIYYKDSNNNYILCENTSISTDLDSCFKYLMSSYASDFSHDVVIIDKENWRQDWYKFFPNPVVGNHETISWRTQHIILIISGGNVRKGESSLPARILDIAPTVLKLAGIVSINMDGMVLEEGRISLILERDALKSESERDLLEDKMQ